jgi:hypothetical protein
MDEWIKGTQIAAHIANVILALGAVIAGVVALQTYRKTAKLERAKWLAGLYEKFYEKSDLKGIREILDCDDEISLDITKLVRDEPSDFTDYLNFFEFVAFLQQEKQLEFREINHIFSYYLNCLERRADIRKYKVSKDYQPLDRLLTEYKEEMNK